MADKRIVINNFSNGMADDRFSAVGNQYGFSKQFDTITFPKKLKPLRGMTSHTSGTNIGNMIVASNGLIYAIGDDTVNSNPGKGKIWYLADYGGSTDFTSIPTNNQLSGQDVNYDFFVEFPDTGQARTLYWASHNILVASDPAGATSASTQSLTFTTIGQGLVHPKDRQLYFTYKNSSAHYIGIIPANATVWTGISTTAFTLPFFYRAYCLSWYGNYLAVPLTSTNGAGIQASEVGLWGRDTSVTTFDETIPWGAGSFQVLNNLNGELIGISTFSANYTGSFQDYDSILIKTWSGGASPTLIKELKVPYAYASSPTVSHPQATINPRVNFIYNNRLYFSVNLVSGDSVHPNRYGLWSVGRDKLTGQWTVIQERVATNDNSETGIIAAALTGDYLECVHTSVGTLTKTINGVQANTTYAATSVWESAVNQGMDDQDKALQKKIDNVSIRCEPLPTSATITLKYRVDSMGSDADWTTLITFTTASGVEFDTGSLVLTDGYNYEFRVESTGGGIPLSIAYRYHTLSNLI